ncbi:MAG: DUF2207 domain-containing protein [Desulfobacteraceae bacterium]|jgi:uncharacterized membrane protein YgcG|nr:DUF2207 domain-containing protein [Desulfobacteraceae bacterium]
MDRCKFTKILAFFFFSLIIGQVELSLAAKAEKIVDFQSRIVVHQDGSMTVSETIRVICARDEIKRGIIREFPTTYKDRYGNRVRVGFKVLKVLRDGRQEPYHIKDSPNGKKVYIGKESIQLKSGTYTYTITYKTDRQLGFFKDFDELYWNVTGNGWSFAIDHASAVVKLPPGAEILQTAGYTGPTGSDGQDFISDFDEEGNITFATTRTLKPKEGLTIAVAWPKGYAAEPTARDKLGYLLKDNRSAALGATGLMTLLIYYGMAWLRVGKDPSKGAIIPLFSPPKNISPALARLIMRLGWRDDKLFAVAVINMAVKGFLTISEDENGEYTLKKTDNGNESLSGGEARSARILFSSGNSIKLKQTNHEDIRKAKKKLLKRLMLEAHRYFALNSGYFIAGVLITIITLLAIILGARQLQTALFMAVWLSIWTLGCCALGFMVFSAWKNVLKSGDGKLWGKSGAIFITLFSLPFFAGEVFGLWTFSTAVSPLATVTLFVFILINAIFYHLLKAPTLTGRKLMDQIDGFKLYLSVAEKDRLNFLNPPDRTPELFERYLPYALALDVEQEWSEQFATVLAKAAQSGTYRPAWYSGHNWQSWNTTGFASNLGSSFSGAISSASTAPGSSSGSGGGGSSGGGGGGGGGSGW